MEDGESGSIELGSSRRQRQLQRKEDKMPVMEAPLIGSGSAKTRSYPNGVKRGVSVLDLVVRLAALAAALAATITMGTTDQTLPFFTQFFQFHAQYNDLPTFTYFVIANAISSAYLVLSLPLSIVTIVRPLATPPRLLLITFDAMHCIASFADCGGLDNISFGFGCSHSVLGSQRKRQCQLDCHLPAIRQFLPEDERSRCRLLPCRGSLHHLGHPLYRCSQKLAPVQGF